MGRIAQLLQLVPAVPIQASDLAAKLAAQLAEITSGELSGRALERALQELSDVLYRQQRELDALRERAQQLVQQVQSLEDRGADPTRVEIPPHY